MTSKTKALLIYGEEVLLSNIDSAHSCGSIALAEAKKLKKDSLIIDAHLLKGYCYEAEAKYKFALKHFLLASDLSKKIQNKKKLAQCYTAMGVIYWYQGFYDKAEEYYKKNIVLCKQLNDLYGMAASYGNLAILFDEKKDLHNALLNAKTEELLTYFFKGKSGITACGFFTLLNCLIKATLYHKYHNNFPLNVYG